jgi:DNA-binding winged helix-turn-helix (wHTH) protein
MHSTATSRKIIQFGEFDIDPSGALRKNGLRLRLQGQPLQILLLLLDSHGEIVTRDLLRERLWSADTFVDFEHSLNTAVKKLRHALGDDPDNPRFVETVPRRGYRFIAPVTVSSPSELPRLEAENPATGPLEVPTVHSAWPKKKVAIAASVCIAGAVLATVASFLRSRTSPQTDAHPVQITTNAAEIPISGSAISPDGRYLAYSDPTGLYLRIVATGATHPVELPTGLELHPDSWFPDGTQFVATQFTTSAPRVKPSLWLVPLVGSPRKLTEGLGCRNFTGWFANCFSQRCVRDEPACRQRDLGHERRWFGPSSSGAR